MKKNIFSKVMGLLFLAGAMTLVSCEENDDYKSLGKLAINLNQQIPDTVLFGQKLKMDVIANKAQAFTLTLFADKNPAEPVYDSTFANTGDKFLFSGEVTVPTDSSWAGAFTIKVVSGDVTDTKKVFFKKPAVVDYYLVGGATAAGWTPGNGMKLMFYSKTEGSGATKTKKEWYDIFGYFTQDGMKLLPTTSGWNGGVAEDKNTPGVLTAKDPQDIKVPAADYYRLRVTLNKSSVEGATYQLVPSKWGVIGDATPGGWDADTDMTFTSGKSKNEWTITLPLEGGKAFKFRENDSWAVNLGPEGSDNKLKQDGGNITVPTTGSYTITLDLKPTGYTYSINKN